MRMREFGFATITICVLLSLSLLTYPHAAHAQDSQESPPGALTLQVARDKVPRTVSFAITISKLGFNGTRSSNLAITVNEGDRIQITFIMDEEERKDVNPNNRHMMEITGYALITEEINPSHPEATIVFLADKPGTFTIRCSADTWDCPGHENMQDGKLEVKSEEGNPPPAETSKTELKLVASAECFPPCPVALTATLIDGENRPIAGMPVAFFVNTTFGTMKIGSPYTNSGGSASMNYSAARAGTLEFTGLFPGGGGYESSTSTVVIQLPAVETAPSNSFPGLSLLTARNAAAGIAAVVTLSLWGTYLYALLLVRGIAQAKKGGDKQTEHSD